MAELCDIISARMSLPETALEIRTSNGAHTLFFNGMPVTRPFRTSAEMQSEFSQLALLFDAARIEALKCVVPEHGIFGRAAICKVKDPRT
jgi:hypothetical protein